MLEILLPVIFFIVMCIPKHYIKTQTSPLQLFPTYDIDSPGWGLLYQGPASETLQAKLLYTPNTPEVTDVMRRFASSVACPFDPNTKHAVSESFFRFFPLPSDVPEKCTSSDWRDCAELPDCYLPLMGEQIVGVESPEEAEMIVLRNPGTVDAIIDFSRANFSTADYTYTLRVNSTVSPSTRVLFNAFDIAPDVEYKSYWWFANVQAVVEQAILNSHVSPLSSNMRSRLGVDEMPLLKVHLNFKPFPWPSFTLDLGATAAALFFNLLLVYSFLNPTRSSASAIVAERELQLRDGMKLLGLTDSAYWASWGISHFTLLAISGTLCALVGMYPFQRTSFSLMLSFFWLASAALLAFAYCLSAFFSRARVAATGVTVLFAVAMAPGYMAPAVSPLGGYSWAAACLLPPSAISLFAHVLVRQEGAGRGLTWHTLSQPIASEGIFSGSTVLIMLAVDVMLYSALLWYFDNVLPTRIARLPWYFPFSSSYWKRDVMRRVESVRDDAASSEPLLSRSGHSAVELLNISKIYKAPTLGPIVALDNLTLKVKRGEIVGLLGRNGAGKTTALSILAGVLPPSSGEVMLDGVSIRERPSILRGKLGICPQFDILWPELKVREHLELAAAIKGLVGADQQKSAEEMAQKVGLSEKLDALSSELSGGQKRKLSCALAFIGSPPVVVLDEVSSGMDPVSKRVIWSLLEEHRSHRSAAILLATHSMEEADTMCDRVAILAEGTLTVDASPQELKVQYGVGYVLDVSLFEDVSHQATSEVVAAKVQEMVPEASVIRHQHRGVTLRLPRESVGSFPAMLRHLEHHKVELGIDSYGIKLSTLEDVFMKASSKVSRTRASPSQPKGDAEDKSDFVVVNVGPSPTSPGKMVAHWATQVHALFQKRALCAYREPGVSLIQFLVPVAIVLLSLWAAGAGAGLPYEPALVLDRKTVLSGHPAAFAASPLLRDQADLLNTFEDRYSRDAFFDTNATSIIRVPYFQPLQGSLDAALLENWWNVSFKTNDALFVETLPDFISMDVDNTTWTEPGARIAFMVNQTALHAVPAAISSVHSALLRCLVTPGNEQTQSSSIGFHAINAPLPPAPGGLGAMASEMSSVLLLILCVQLATSVLSASCSIFLVKERESGSRALQNIAGVSSSAYCVANFLWDYGAQFSLTAMGIMIAITLFGFPQVQGEQRGLAIAVLLWLFGAAAVPMSQSLQHFFKDETKALQRLSSFYFMIGYLGFLATWILELIVSMLQPPGAIRVGRILRALLSSVSPHYCLTRGLFLVTQSYREERGLPNTSPWQDIHNLLFNLVVQAVAYFTITLIVESDFLTACAWWLQEKCSAQHDGSILQDSAEDAEVRSERLAIESGQIAPQSASALLKGVSKTYGGGRVKAVRGVWLSVLKGQCFGLLGVNGAGKTTTFKMLTGEVRPETGDAYVSGNSVLKHRTAARSHLGYCPQSSALPSGLTGQEVVKMYALLRGVPQSLLHVFVNRLLKQFELSAIGNKPCGTYSGGNKRRLAVAVALTAGRELCCLDEPSTGLDPAARRALWHVLREEGRNSAILLTTHSMEEAEAVCGRIAIMSAGRIKALGSPQQLRDRLAAGYILQVEFQGSEEYLESLLALYKLQLRRRTGNTSFTYQLSISSSAELAGVFEVLESSKTDGETGLIDYTLSQNTLEHAFLLLNG